MTKSSCCRSRRTTRSTSSTSSWSSARARRASTRSAKRRSSRVSSPRRSKCSTPWRSDMGSEPGREPPASESERLFAEALESLVGGVDSPVRAFRSVGGTPRFMVSGKGSSLWDVDGQQYLDFCMSWGALLLGRANPAVVRAVRRAAGHGTSFGTATESEVRLAQAVKNRFRSIDLLRFVSSGTEATMSAVRVARGFTGRDKIVTFEGAYHGHADALLVKAGSGLAASLPGSAAVSANALPDTLW